MEKLFRWLTNEKYLRNVRTVLIAIVVIGIPLIYFGFFDNINIKSLLTIGTTTLTILGLFVVWLWKFEVMNRAEYDEFKNNTYWQELEEHINKEVKKIDDPKQANDYINDYNKKEQLYYDTMLTNGIIEKLKTKIVKRIANGKKVTKLEKKIELLEKSPKKNKKYVQLNSKDILLANNRNNKNDINGRNLFVYNHKTDGIGWEIATSTFNMVGIGGTAGIHFWINTDLWTIVIYYLLLFTVLALTTVFKYSSTIVKLKDKYIPTRINIYKFLVEMNESIKKEDTN